MENINILWLVITLLSLSIIIYMITLFFDKIKNKNGIVVLKAIKTHENRTLYFTKGKEYKFYKSNDVLMLNEDDISRDRDNYVFYGIDLTDNFQPTDMFSKYALKQIKYIP
jgi:hypothetical protein